MKSQEKIRPGNQIEPPMRKSLHDLVRAEVFQSPSLAVISDKSEDLLEMERIIKSVYKIKMRANPFLKKDWSPEEFKSLIEEDAVLFLKNYGIDLCRRVSDPIINLINVPFGPECTTLDFYHLCKNQKRREDEEEKTAAYSNRIADEQRARMDEQRVRSKKQWDKLLKRKNHE